MPRPPPRSPTTAAADFREAFTYLWGNHLLRKFVLFSCIVGSLLAFAQSTMVLLFLDTLEVPVVLIGFVTAAIGLGGLVGALTASALVARFGRGRVMFAATLIGTAGLVATGLAPNVWVACVAYAVSAAGISTWNVPWGALRQDIVPGRLLGRVTGLNRSIVWGSFVVAGLIGGLVSRIDLRLPYIIGGALAVLVTLVAARMLLRVDASTADHHARVASAEAAVADAASDAVGRLVSPTDHAAARASRCTPTRLGCDGHGGGRGIAREPARRPAGDRACAARADAGTARGGGVRREHEGAAAAVARRIAARSSSSSWRPPPLGSG